MNERPHYNLFRPFRAKVSYECPTQGGAQRLRRFALPWADMLRPLWGEDVYNGACTRCEAI
jgi:hypothetical protein